MEGTHVQVIAAGAAVLPVARVAADHVICADSGVSVALAAGCRIDLVVGDLDSADAEDLSAARLGGATVEAHPTTKDESDLELALLAAMDQQPTKVTVHLADGGRLDHQLANLLVLASPRWGEVVVHAWVGGNQVFVVRGRFDVPLGVGAPVALQAVGGAATVTTTGLAYALDREVIQTFEARGIANIVESGDAVVHVHEGVVLLISSGF